MRLGRCASERLALHCILGPVHQEDVASCLAMCIRLHPGKYARLHVRTQQMPSKLFLSMRVWTMAVKVSILASSAAMWA